MGEIGPIGTLAYLYVGTADFHRDLGWYRDVLGADLVWEFERYGARVAAFRVGPGPLLLLASHRPAPSCMPIYAVVNLDAAERTLRTRGFRPLGDRFEVPDGPCLRFDDPSGNPYAFLQRDRPDAMDRAWREQQRR